MNNPIVKLLVVLVIILGGGFYGLTTYRKKSAEYENKLDLERIRKEWLERQPLARQLAAPDKYRFEQQALFKWYFNELTEHYNKFQGLKDYEKVGDDLEAKKKAKKIKDNEYNLLFERYKSTKDFWDLAMANKYDPVFTAVDNGLRFDIFKVESVSDSKEPKLRLHYALWGAQRKWSVDSSSGGKVLKLTVNAAFHELTVLGLDEAGKEATRMTAAGDPYKVDNPERFIEEFPPGVVFGSYDLPKIPSNVVTVEISWDIGTRSVLSGEEVSGKFVWKQPLPSEWKGGNWADAQEQVRDAPEEPTPTKGKKK
ncbi:MAG TPA: hypothetical protein VGK67_37550 [Myxococcales bacterium]|jgi:hypothetical protein